MKIMFFFLAVSFLLAFAAAAKETKQIFSVESIQVLQILPQDEKAVIKMPDGRREILKVGDSIGERGKVIEIVEGRIVIEEKTEKGPETVIIRFENGKQRIERIRKTGDKQPVLYAPK